MSSTPQFSIIIPVYNVEQYLAKCLESLLNQINFNDYEIILIDDSSKDNSSEIAKKYAKNNSETVKYFLKENGGAASARNYGLLHAKGNFVIFIDSDDYIIDNQFLLNISKIISENKNVDYIIYNYCKLYLSSNDFSTAKLKYENNENTYYVFEEINECFKNNLVDSSPWNKVVKRELLKESGIEFEKGRFSEDIDWNIKVISQANTAAFYSPIVLAYVQREGSITDMIGTKNVLDLKVAIEKCLDLYNIEKIQFPDLEKYIQYQYITFLITASSLLTDELIYQEVTDLTKKICKTLPRKNKQGKLIFWVVNIIGTRRTAKLLNTIFSIKNKK